MQKNRDKNLWEWGCANEHGGANPGYGSCSGCGGLSEGEK